LRRQNTFVSTRDRPGQTSHTRSRRGRPRSDTAAVCRKSLPRGSVSCPRVSRRRRSRRLRASP
jgi:hypothetical protein